MAYFNLILCLCRNVLVKRVRFNTYIAYNQFFIMFNCDQFIINAYKQNNYYEIER